MDCVCFFFFKQMTAYELRIIDWSSDVCSSDLERLHPSGAEVRRSRRAEGADRGGCRIGAADARCAARRRDGARPFRLRTGVPAAIEAAQLEPERTAWRSPA